MRINSKHTRTRVPNNGHQNAVYYISVVAVVVPVVITFVRLDQLVKNTMIIHSTDKLKLW